MTDRLDNYEPACTRCWQTPALNGTCGCDTPTPPHPTPTTHTYPTGVSQNPAWQPHHREWRNPNPTPNPCTHTTNNTLCPHCTAQLNLMLTDLPELLHQLGITTRKDHTFPPRGTLRTEPNRADEAPIPWNPAAANMHRRIRAIILDPATRDPANRVWLHDTLAAYTTRAHELIDRPADRIFAGQCPTCGAALHGERGQVVTCHNLTPAGAECGYQATWDHHTAAQLEQRRDQWLPMRELVTCLMAAGHGRRDRQATKDRINYLVARHGLPREKRLIAHWAGQTIQTEEVWTYRPTDVLELETSLK